MLNNSILLKLLCLLVLITACNQFRNEQKKTNTKQMPPKNIMFNKESETNSLIDQLQGEWKRTSYPYGTIVVKNNSLKNNEGEGLAEEPIFEPFTLQSFCEGKDAIQIKKSAYIYYVNLNVCVRVELSNDTLKLGGTGDNNPILYVKSK